MSTDRYTRGEVAYLLGLTHWEALQDDIAQPDSCALLNQDGPLASTTHEEWDPLFTIARWNDVQNARRRVVVRRMETAGAELEQIRFELQILHLRSHGLTERQVGEVLGVNPLLARRRFGAAVDDVVQELGGPAAPPADRLSTVPACMACGERPRARLAQRTRKRAGAPPRVMREERLSSLCRECTPVARRRFLVPPRAADERRAS